MNRRNFIKTSSVVLTGTVIFPGCGMGKSNELRFGWVTDIHYALAKPRENKYYTESLTKLKEAIDLYRMSDLDFVIELGDFVDENKIPVFEKSLQYLHSVEAEFCKYEGDRYHVLGNHDMNSLSKSDFLNAIENTGISNEHSFYSFQKNGFKCIVLDACYRSDGVVYDKGNFEWTDTIIPDAQLKWLKEELNKSNSPILIFVHQLLDGKGDLYVNNSVQVREILEESGKVFAVFQGHQHKGQYNKINNIHYITEKALVDGSGAENNSYCIVTVKGTDQIVIDGYRRMEDMKL